MKVFVVESSEYVGGRFIAPHLLGLSKTVEGAKKIVENSRELSRNWAKQVIEDFKNDEREDARIYVGNKRRDLAELEMPVFWREGRDGNLSSDFDLEPGAIPPVYYTIRLTKVQP